ncbi:NUDIX hydrolase [Cellulomonas sp. NPDC089187]|uniref:NUDIX hydrolase n=1 Tax=Cellulomonas sp. NPDC089187 TaxID=3154970 RepID=UPI0034399939
MAGDSPTPTGLVRLLLRRGDDVFCVPREDGRIDLPTRAVPAADHDGSLTARRFASEVLASPAVIEGVVGYVRNVVPEPTSDYPWPSPRAHFTVWAVRGEPAVDGQWVSTGVDSPLRDRHWFALLGA